MEKELRRNQNTLVIVGTGVIVFGIWSFIRTMTGVLLNTEDSGVGEMTADVQDIGLTENAAHSFVVVLLLIILAVIILLRIYVGRSAILEGRERKRRRGYLGLALLMAAFNGLYVVFWFFNAVVFFRTQGTGNSGDISVSSLIIDTTSFLTLVEMIRAAYRVRSLKKKLELQESQAEAGSSAGKTLPAGKRGGYAA